ncbi:hypothetical protein Agub_g319, partial [Astrephomene gubernaculifera]
QAREGRPEGVLRREGLHCEIPEAGAGARQSSSCKTTAGRLKKPPGRQESRNAVLRYDSRRLVRVLLYGMMVVVLVLYAVHTWRRNYDWWSEETLFESAGKVCPDSAKVQLNLGILQRRRGQQRAALGHFRRAREIEAGYCEPGYWIGVSLVSPKRVCGSWRPP